MNVQDYIKFRAQGGTLDALKEAQKQCYMDELANQINSTIPTLIRNQNNISQVVQEGVELASKKSELLELANEQLKSIRENLVKITEEQSKLTKIAKELKEDITEKEMKKQILQSRLLEFKAELKHRKKTPTQLEQDLTAIGNKISQGPANNRPPKESKELPKVHEQAKEINNSKFRGKELTEESQKSVDEITRQKAILIAKMGNIEKIPTPANIAWKKLGKSTDEHNF